MSNSELKALREYLTQIPPGAVSSIEEIPGRLARCWDALTITDTHGMRSDKLYRIEQVWWSSPRLSFEIERHSGTVKGSVDAEVQTWIIDLDQRTASYEGSRKRLARELQAGLKVKPLVAEIVHLIEDRTNNEHLRWPSDSRVRVLIEKIIPDSAAQQTVAGRRRRFCKQLEPALKQRGWELVSGTSSHTYQRV